MAMALGITAGIVAAGGLFRVFFADADDFYECLGYVFRPDWYSMLEGTWFEDMWASWKVRIWVLLSIAAGVGVYWLLGGKF